MSADNNIANHSSDNGVESVESLTLTLQQIAASAQTNTEQFESQKKQFFEQFSQLFGSLNLKQKQTNLNNEALPTAATKPPIPNILSPSMDSPNMIVNRSNNPTAPKSTPSITKQSSFSAQSDSNNTSNSNPSESNINPILTKMPTTAVTAPINTLNFAQAQAYQNNANLFSPQQIQTFQSVPMSIISNNSQSHSTVYQYPYITSGPNCNQILSSPNLHNIIVPNINTLKSPHILNNLSFTPTANSIKSSQSLTAFAPVNRPQFMSSYSASSQGNVNTANTNTNTNNVTAYESYWMRRILSNILLLFFRYHPNGVLECELSQFYEQMFNEQLVLTMDLKYLLCVHKSILITNTKERGQLYTLADDEIPSFLQEFDTLILQQWIIKHIRRLFRCFPNGIACNCLQDLLYNMVEFKLEDVIPHGKWHEFVCNIPTMYCCNINGVNIFITIDLNELNKMYKSTNTHTVGHNEHVITGNNIQYYLSNFLNFKNILSRPVGYCELLIVLLANYYTTDVSNVYYKGIDGETLEKAFHHQYQSRLVHEAPFIQDVLGKICDIIVQNNGTDGSQTKLYKLVASSKQYFDTQPDAFAPILHRSLELLNMNNIEIPCANANGSNEESNVPQSPFKEDHVSVFMGGFSHGTTIEDLRNELAKKGVTMISSSGISYRNYGWSFVTLSNDKEAQYLISISPIQILGRNIDIRPFINRQRIRNHISNKPSDKVMLNAMIELLHKLHGGGAEGLTVADIQSKLFRRFSYRIDGPQLTKIVGDNPKYLYIKRQQTERIYLTPKLSMNTSMEELKNKIAKLWKHIQCNYRGDIYALDLQKKEPCDDEKTEEKSEDKKKEQDVDDNKEETATLKSVLSTTSSKSSGKRSRRRGGKHRNKLNTTLPNGIPNGSATMPIPEIAMPGTTAPIVVTENEYVISENDFENEFARRYRFAVCANNFGCNSVKELLESLSVPFKVIIYENIEDDTSTNPYTKTKPYTLAPGSSFNKNNLNINLTSPNIVNPNTNITSPRYINSPSNYSGYSSHSYSAHPAHRTDRSNNNTNVAANYVGFVPYNNAAAAETQLATPTNVVAQGNLLYQQYAMQQLPANKAAMPYVSGGNSASNYSIIPSVPNSIITSNSLNSQPNANNINLNTINMNINMRPYLNMSNMSNIQAVTSAVSAQQRNINSNVENSATK